MNVWTRDEVNLKKVNQKGKELEVTANNQTTTTLDPGQCPETETRYHRPQDLNPNISRLNKIKWNESPENWEQTTPTHPNNVRSILVSLSHAKSLLIICFCFSYQIVPLYTCETRLLLVTR